MPLFEYRCGNCGHLNEFLERAGEERSRTCEECGSSDLEKQLSVFSAGETSKSSSDDFGSCPTGTCSLP